MTPAPAGARWIALATLLTALTFLSSCGGESRSRGGLEGLPEAPTEGTILYFEPASNDGIKKLKTRPVTQILTTAKGEVADDSTYQSYSGTVEGVSRGQTLTDRQMQEAIQRMMQRTNAGATRVLAPEKFETLWNRLAVAGLFDLPPYANKERPQDVAHFLVKAGDKSWIFTRPPATPKAGGEGKSPSQIWTASTLVFVDFVNER